MSSTKCILKLVKLLKTFSIDSAPLESAAIDNLKFKKFKITCRATLNAYLFFIVWIYHAQADRGTMYCALFLIDKSWFLLAEFF